jgi:hypothetical protein
MLGPAQLRPRAQGDDSEWQRSRGARGKRKVEQIPVDFDSFRGGAAAQNEFDVAPFAASWVSGARS